MGGTEKGREWQLGAIVNKIEFSNPIISLINYIDAAPNSISTKMLAIADSGVNIHLARQATPKMSPIVMENEMKLDYQMESLWSQQI